MTSLRDMPRYIRNTDAFGWQGAEGPSGPWRSITPPQSGTPWQTTNPMDNLRQVSADVSGVEVLSPAAQAVMNAATNGNTNVVNDPVYRQCIAAALRAAADQLGDEMIVVGEGFKGLTRDDWRIVHVEDLLAIADELEAQ